MTKESLRIVFMGTPEFAVESLRALVDGGYHVVGVITMPDKPVGRHGSVLQPSAVKQFYLDRHLEEQGVVLMQPERLKDEMFLQQLEALGADLQIVVAFRMLPEVVWAMPPLGTFNLHASLLPQYRGAAPINWAVINGETETGITTFFLKQEIDTGEVIQQVRVPIADTDNVGAVHDRLMLLGGKLVTETVDHIVDGTIRPIDQELLMGMKTVLKPAPKIFRDTCRIDWNQSQKRVYDFVRGLSPYPGAWTEWVGSDGQPLQLKIFTAHKPDTDFEPDAVAGTLYTDGSKTLAVKCGNGWLGIDQLQLAGKRRMGVEDFLRGTKLGADFHVR